MLTVIKKRNVKRYMYILKNATRRYVCNSAILRCACTLAEIQPLRCHTLEFVNPESFTFSSELNIICLKVFNDHDGKIFFHVVSRLIEVLSHFRFLCLPDVRSVAIEANVQGILCRANILFWALPALNQIDHIL